MTARQLVLLRSRAVAVAGRWRYHVQRQVPTTTSGHGALSPVAASSCRNVQTRTFATARASSSADSYLLEVLKSEIKHESQEESSKKGSLKGSAGPFEVVDKSGIEEILLKRSFGKEQITLSCVKECKYQEDTEEHEDNEESQKDNEEEEEAAAEEQKLVETLQFNVAITKDVPMPAVEFECKYARGDSEITIESVSFLTEDSQQGDDNEACNAYEGPDFSGLDENLQRAFHDVLKARGVTPKVATHALDYLSKKEHREYIRWLQNVETFFKSDNETG